MSLLKFLIFLSVGTILSWLTWVVVLRSLDPYSGGAVALLLFYLSLWLSAVGTMTILGFFLRAWLENDGIYFRQIGVSLRQASFVSSGVIVALCLQAARWLNVWSGLSLVVLVLMLELFFLFGQTERESPLLGRRA